MIGPTRRAIALVAALAATGCINRTTVIYPPASLRQNAPPTDPTCIPPFDQDSTTPTTVGAMRDWVRGHQQTCHGLAVFAHRSGASINWSSDDPSALPTEEVQQLLIEVKRSDTPAPPFRLHAIVGPGTTFAPTSTTTPISPPSLPSLRPKPTLTLPSRFVPVSGPTPVSGSGPPPTPAIGRGLGPTPPEPSAPIQENAALDNETGAGPGRNESQDGTVNDGPSTPGNGQTRVAVISAATGAGLTYALFSLGLLGAPGPAAPMLHDAGQVARRGESADGEEPDEAGEQDAAVGDSRQWDPRLRVRSAGIAEGPS